MTIPPSKETIKENMIFLTGYLNRYRQKEDADGCHIEALENAIFILGKYAYGEEFSEVLAKASVGKVPKRMKKIWRRLCVK